MKKVSLFVLLLFFGVTLNSFAQATPPTDFYAGKWEVLIVGIPNGDAKLIAELVRKDGKLTGQLTNPSEPGSEKIPLESVTEAADKLSFAFTAQGHNVTMDLVKVDDDTLKGSIMGGMFDASAKRVKN
ncbi:hypothetical protein [Fibrella arboris]|uniref:hypothetical protein n=1 Tax=Fibrella arboris TaxID=3242486 RepID=UPI003520154E